MKIINLFFFCLFFFSISVFAQEMPSIQTDRPDQTECPFITPTKFVQMEIGFSYEEQFKNSTESVLPTILTRYGINENFELRLITEFTSNSGLSERYSGIQPVFIGFKSKLFKEKGFLPTTSFIGHIGIPKLASERYKKMYYAPEFRFTMQHTLSEKQSLSYNLGAEWDGETAEPTFIYTLTSGYSFSEKVSGYVELYGFVPQIEKADHRMDAGINYLWNDNHQLDFSGGIGLSENAPEYFVSLGYSFRFKI